MHRNAYAVLIKEAMRLNLFEKSRFCKDVLRVITMIALVRRSSRRMGNELLTWMGEGLQDDAVCLSPDLHLLPTRGLL